MPTTVSHDALPRFTAAIVANVPDAQLAAPPTPTEAAVALARLEAMSGDVRGAVILGPEGAALAASGDSERWTEAARAMLAAADAAAGEPVSHAHVGTEDGEAFAVRQGGFALVAAAERFTLASLVFADMRAVLREVAG
jgi:predicted regulator of Ras-like GTPase activity (Roadblock/LC7/MglB family)